MTSGKCTSTPIKAIQKTIPLSMKLVNEKLRRKEKRRKRQTRWSSFVSMLCTSNVFSHVLILHIGHIVVIVFTIRL